MAHTAIWPLFVACVVTIAALGLAEMHRQVIWLTGIVIVEILVLLLNGWQRPLTRIAARHTVDRRDNSDIYLAAWLARYGKTIFGSLFVAGKVIVALRWRGRAG